MDSPYIDSCFNLSITATSLQRQLPLKCVPRRHNYLSTTASFFQQPMKKSRIDSYGAMKINRSSRILIVFHLYCCSKHKLSTTLITNVDNLARFVYFWHFDSKHQVCLCILFGLSLWDTVSKNLTQQINRTSLKKKFLILHPCLPTSRPLSSVPKVAVVERFDCTEFDSHGTMSIKRINVSTGCNPVS